MRPDPQHPEYQQPVLAMQRANSLTEILELAIRFERNAQLFYAEVAARTELSGDVRGLARRLAAEEAGHVYQLEALRRHPDLVGYLYEQIPEHQQQERFTSLAGNLTLPAACDTATLLHYAINREKTAYAHYAHLANSTKFKAAAKLFRLLSQEEEQHRKEMETRLQQTLYRRLTWSGLLDLLWLAHREQLDLNLRFHTTRQQRGHLVLQRGELVRLEYAQQSGDAAARLLRQVTLLWAHHPEPLRALIERIEQLKLRAPQLPPHALPEGPAPGLPQGRGLLQMLGIDLAAERLAPHRALTKDADGRVRRVLVAEDSPTTRKLICTALRGAGFEVSEARDGFSALAVLGQERVDLIVLDLVMPGLDGYQVISAVRNNPRTQETPIIVLTSRGGLLDRLKGRLGAMDEYLVKPFPASRLLEVIYAYLEREEPLGIAL